MYYSFATTNVPTFKNFNIEKSTVDKIQYLKIISNSNFKITELDKNFGKASFWQEIEKILVGGRKISEEL